MRSSLKAACIFGGLLFALSAQAAENFGPFDKIEYQPLKEVWVATGFETWHFNSNLGLNNHNPGWGAEYRFSTTTSVIGGRFFNSDWQDSNYLGINWNPLAMGPFRLGLFAGLFDGYPRMMNGGTFAAVVPAISVEYGRLGANFIIVPTIQNRLYGGISLQLKLKLF
jgi:hypothetical protein